MLTGVCVLAHLAMARSAAAHGSVTATAIAAGLAALCLPCAGRLWSCPDGGVWRMTAGTAAVMLAVHPLMEHAHGAGVTAVARTGGATAAVALLVIAGAIIGLRRPGARPSRAVPWRLRRDDH
ncbi:hypothetical protein Apa02nite_059900 [Actinoplanes palleronii]|uniref:Uncharacterized protein n=1 Tax=Actinoplanes palleronii TaxID=113570 RepID=A0ABQ4BH08_9ACTN|nr:hypothetical protein Apa02nite_059900 [Actinoplanes palleronii]